MTPGAQIGAGPDLLEIIDNKARPADHLASAYFPARRYIGSHDRRNISLSLWGLMRRRARLDWWLRSKGAPEDSRRRVIADLVLEAKMDLGEMEALFAGRDHSPERLSAN